MDILDFKNKHKNKDCVILTCGPSLLEYSKEDVVNFLQYKIVICIKESIIEYGKYAHYFFSNNTRDRKYDLSENTISIFQKQHIKSKNRTDLVLPEDLPFKKAKQLLRMHNFEDYEFDKNIKRPWGPGILFESVFYFCKYIGINNIYTIGWDLSDISKDNCITHYFDNDTNINYKSSKRYNNNDKILANKHKEEIEMVNKNIPKMYNYFKENGMNIFVVGIQSYVNNEIPRIYI